MYCVEHHHVALMDVLHAACTAWVQPCSALWLSIQCWSLTPILRLMNLGSDAPWHDRMQHLQYLAWAQQLLSRLYTDTGREFRSLRSTWAP